MKRYYIDKRIGCIAVCDSTKTVKGSYGLHLDSVQVVKLWIGNRSSNGDNWLWCLSDEIIQEAEQYCDKLNSEN